MTLIAWIILAAIAIVWIWIICRIFKWHSENKRIDDLFE